jgi:hypothetical protein
MSDPGIQSLIGFGTNSHETDGKRKNPFVCLAPVESVTVSMSFSITVAP